jgi:hypothetical protein
MMSTLPMTTTAGSGYHASARSGRRSKAWPLILLAGFLLSAAIVPLGEHFAATQRALGAERSAGSASARALAATNQQGSTVFSVDPARNATLLNGAPFQVVGLRTSNALISDAATQQLIDNMGVFAGYGINTFSLFFQGSRFGDIKGYNEDATLNSTYAARMARIIEAADVRGMVILVGGLYYGTSTAKWPSWGRT